MTQVDTLLRSVEHSRAALLESTAHFNDAQATFKPAQEQWSIVEA